MRVHWPDDPAWQALGAAVGPGLALAAALPLPAELTVVAGDGPEWARRVDAARVALHPALLGPALTVGPDAAWAAEGHPGVALDRFRRATGLLLEAALLPPGEADWPAVARAADAVDQALPALAWLTPEAAGLRLRPEAGLVAHPRRGAWWRRYQNSRGADPEALPTPQDWADFGQWCRDGTRGPAASVAADLPLAPPRPPEDALALPPWSHAVLRMRPGPAGARLALPAGAASAPGACAAPGVVVVGATEALALPVPTRPAGPVGGWALDSGSFAGRLGAARGVVLRLLDDGRAELVAADAFLGPPSREVLEMAEQVGVSGLSAGRWRLESVDASGRSGVLRLSGFDARGGTLHPRTGAGFALPASAWLEPVQQVLDQLAAAPIGWARHDGGLRLTGDVAGVALELRLSPAG